MTTIPHESSGTSAKPRLSSILVRDVAASTAITVIWLAVLFDAVFGPDFVSASDGSMTRIPSGIIVAFFAVLATRAVARYGFAPPKAG
jgi:hypothetical protein